MKREAKLVQEKFNLPDSRYDCLVQALKKAAWHDDWCHIRALDASKTVSRLPAVNASHVISMTAQALFKSFPSTATLTRQPEIGTLHIGAVPFHYYYYSVRR